MGRPIRIARSRQFVKLRAEENAESGDTSTTEESAESGDTSTELNSSVEQADTADENGKWIFGDSEFASFSSFLWFSR